MITPKSEFLHYVLTIIHIITINFQLSILN